jgi:hypothetical protein
MTSCGISCTPFIGWLSTVPFSSPYKHRHIPSSHPSSLKLYPIRKHSPLIFSTDMFGISLSTFTFLAESELPSFLRKTIPHRTFHLIQGFAQYQAIEHSARYSDTPRFSYSTLDTEDQTEHIQAYWQWARGHILFLPSPGSSEALVK